MVMFPFLGKFVKRFSLAEIQSMDQTCLCEGFERTIRSGLVRGLFWKRIEQVLYGQRPFLFKENGNYRHARGGGFQSVVP